MGFDLEARRLAKGAVDYYRSGIEHMAFLRAAMVAAGVQEKLVYGKFVSNDRLLVTARQSTMIAEKLAAWLRARNLTLDLAETNPRAHLAMDGLLSVFRAVRLKKEAAHLARRRRATSLPCIIDRRARASIRAFAAFCAGSGGFYVE